MEEGAVIGGRREWRRDGQVEGEGGSGGVWCEWREVEWEVGKTEKGKG